MSLLTNLSVLSKMTYTEEKLVKLSFLGFLFVSVDIVIVFTF